MPTGRFLTTYPVAIPAIRRIDMVTYAHVGTEEEVSAMVEVTVQVIIWELVRVVVAVRVVVSV